MKKKLWALCKRCRKDSEQLEQHEMGKSERHDEPATYEAAISATGFGKFNVMLIVIIIPTVWATMFETTAIAFVTPVAQCDLNLTLEDKGYLISITYLGMVLSALVWGYLADTIGRKRVMVYGLTANFFFVTIGGLAQNFGTLLFAKFMGGFVINGPYAIATTVLSEYHGAKYRAPVILFQGVVFSVATITLPLLSLAIFSTPMDFTLFNGLLNMHSWNVLLLLTAIPNLLSAVGMMLWVPETPKFLMTSGNNDEAMKVFKMIFKMNTGKNAADFPIQKLIDESKTNPSNAIPNDKMVAFKNGMKQMKAIFLPPHLSKNILVCTMSIGNLMGLNSLRLWLPQLFTTINDYEHKPDQHVDVCTILATLQNQTSKALSSKEDTLMDPAQCLVNYENNYYVYYSLMMIYAVNTLGYLFVGFLINTIGKKRLYLFCGVVAGLTAMSIAFAQDALDITLLSATCSTLIGINTNLLMSIIVDLFPTSLRTTAVAISLMVGRSFAMMGNLFFPYLLTSGCFPPFIFIGASTLCGCMLAVLLKNLDMKALE